jgi:hypothetical protein
MSTLERFQFMPCFSIEPNKCSSYNRIFFRSKVQEDGTYNLESPVERRANFKFTEKTKSIKRETHNFSISDNAYRTLKRRINWLHHLSKSREIKTYTGKTIYNFRMAFLTLTLPSTQKHPTAFITKNLLNQFLVEMRSRTGMANYVWRLEFQKNGNVHYHLVTDTYLDYFFALKVWNRICGNFGYVAPYTSKHENMSLNEYNHTYNRDGDKDFPTMAKRYAKGCKNKWLQPPTIQVNSVISKQSIANYLAKYFSKDDADKPISNENDDDDNSKNIRLWFCSRSLSKLASVSGFVEEVEFDIFSIVKTLVKVRTAICKYATVHYFDIQLTSGWSRSFIQKLLKDYSVKQGYIPAT